MAHTLSILSLATFLFAGLTIAEGIDPEWNKTPSITLKDGTENSVVWRAKTGTLSGSVALARNRVLVGARLEEPGGVQGPGAMMGFDRETGALLWTTKHAPLGPRIFDIGMPIVSTPWIEENRAWYQSNRGELVCVDIDGFHDGKPHANTEADVIWSLDMMKELGVFKRGAGDVGSPMSSPTVWGDLVFCVTGEGCRLRGDLGRAPSFLAADKTTGKVVWSSDAPGKNIIYAQWSSPVMARVEGKDQVIFPGGDGWLYAFEPRTGELLWKLDCNEPGTQAWKIEGGNRVEPDKWKLFFMGAPVVDGATLFVGLNMDFEFHPQKAPLLAVSLSPHAATIRWKFQHPEFIGTHGSAAVANGVVYVLSHEGVLFALNERTGEELWHSKFSEGDHSWFYGAPLASHGRVFVGSESGEMFVYAAGLQKKCLARYEFSGISWNTPVADEQFVYVPVQEYLWKLRLPQ